MGSWRVALGLYTLVVGFFAETFDFFEVCPFCELCNGTCTMNATFARQCPTNAWTSASGAVSLGDCLCLSGFRWNASLCVACSESEYCPWGEVNSPVVCPLGYRCTKTDKWPIPGTWDGNETFRICPGGYLCSTNWAMQPVPCGDSAFCPEGSDVSIPCPEGAYCHWNASAPVSCEAGFRCPANISAPIPCEAGYFCPFNESSDRVLCPAGFACPTQASAAILCVSGTLCPNGTGIPVVCAGGWFCPDPAGDALVCYAGSVCPPGSVWPVPCPPGRFCERGASEAAICPLGYYCSGNTSVPLACPGGYVCAVGSSAPTRTTTPMATTTPVIITCETGFVRDITGKVCVLANNISYASLVSVVMPENITIVTLADLAVLTTSVSKQSGCDDISGCTAVILSITNMAGVTIFCTNGVCPGFGLRRLLAATGQYQIIFGVITDKPIVGEPVFSLYAPGTQVPLQCSFVKSTKVDNNLLAEVEALILYVKGGPASTSLVVPIVAGVSGACVVVAVVVGVLMWRRKTRRLAVQAGAGFTMTSDCIPVRIVIGDERVCRVKVT